MPTRFAHPAPHRDRSLGLGYLPDAGMDAPSRNEVEFWRAGAKDGLAFAVEVMRAAQARGMSFEDMVSAVEATHVVPHEATRYGHTYPTGVLMDDADLVEVAYFAWQIPMRGEHDSPEYLRALELCRLGHPTEDEVLAALDGKSPCGSNGDVRRVAEQRRRYLLKEPVQA